MAPRESHQDSIGITVASISLDQLFSGKPIDAGMAGKIEGALHLPEYQRPYRWGGKQLAKLLDDLRAFFGDGAAPSHDFYLGSFILHQTQEEGGRLNIIDGQQRITTMALLAGFLGQAVPDLKFLAPESHRQIQANWRWLSTSDLPAVDFSRVNVTLVVTASEDDAYRFFETQNTNGVRLAGPDIIKALHLRALDHDIQDEKAVAWESMGALDPLVSALMKGRRWQVLDFQRLAGEREKVRMRDEIVAELSGTADSAALDLAYRLVRQTRGAPDESHITLDGAEGYAMRQPLHTGANTIHYLQYFHRLSLELWSGRGTPQLEAYRENYQRLVLESGGSDFLKALYDSAILMYASQFGYRRIAEAGLWLFRVIYSPRLINKRTVRESTVQKFAEDSRVLDWIAASFNHETLVRALKAYRYSVGKENLTKGMVKGQFVAAVREALQVRPLPENPDALALEYDAALVDAIERRCRQYLANNGGKQ
jgi:hypothetical protein